MYDKKNKILNFFNLVTLNTSISTKLCVNQTPLKGLLSINLLLLSVSTPSSIFCHFPRVSRFLGSHNLLLPKLTLPGHVQIFMVNSCPFHILFPLFPDSSRHLLFLFLKYLIGLILLPPYFLLTTSSSYIPFRFWLIYDSLLLSHKSFISLLLNSCLPFSWVKCLQMLSTLFGNQINSYHQHYCLFPISLFHHRKPSSTVRIIQLLLCQLSHITLLSQIECFTAN